MISTVLCTVGASIAPGSELVKRIECRNKWVQTVAGRMRVCRTCLWAVGEFSNGGKLVFDDPVSDADDVRYLLCDVIPSIVVPPCWAIKSVFTIAKQHFGRKSLP